MTIGVLRLVFRLTDARSLKDKRRPLQRIRDRIKNRFNAAVSEVESQDEHRLIVLGVSMVGPDARLLEAELQKVVRFVQELYVAPLIEDRIELVRWSDLTSDAAWDRDAEPSSDS